MIAAQPASSRPRLSPGMVLALALCLALLRLVRLGEWSLWIDEALTWADLHHGLDSEALFNPLGYRLIAAVSGLAALPGGLPDEFALRLLPALAGIACVPVAAWAFTPLLGKRRAAWAAVFLAVSAWHLFWSQTARFYTLAQLTALLGAGLALRGLWCDTGPGASRLMARLRTYAGFALCAAAASFHLSAGLLVPALALGAGLAGGADCERRRRGREALILLAVLSLASIPWAIQPFLHHVGQKPSAGMLGGPLHLGMTAAYFFTPFLAGAALLAAVQGFTRRDPAARLLAILVSAGFGVSFVLATRAQVTAQYVFVLLPFVCALAASLLAAENEDVPRTETALVAALLLASLGNCALYLTSRAGERPRWRDAYQYVDAARRPGDLIAGMAFPVGEFYLGDGSTDLRHARAIAPIGRFFPDGPRHWRRDARRTWLVIRPQWFADMRPADAEVLKEFLRRDCRLMRRFEAPMEGRDLELLVYLEE